MTTKAQHTPGPWTIEAPSKGSPVPIIHGADYSEVASVFADEGEDQRNANACLIAAAPELLAALELAIKSRLLSIDYDRNRTREACDIRRAMIAAIAKAHGEG